MTFISKQNYNEFWDTVVKILRETKTQRFINFYKSISRKKYFSYPRYQLIITRSLIYNSVSIIKSFLASIIL